MREDHINPYIAFADMCVNLVLILSFFLAAVNALGHVGWDQVRYKELQQEFGDAVCAELPKSMRPMPYIWRNDPPGAQRWVFWQKRFFEYGTAKLTPEGREAFTRFARVARAHASQWRRIRVEGHTMPPKEGQPDDWLLSAARAAVVAQVIHSEGHIPAHFLAVSGRGGQNPLNKEDARNPANERVEIVIEFTQRRSLLPQQETEEK